MITDIKESVLLFHKQVVNDEHHRYRSWEHCYSHFQNHLTLTRDSDVDTAALHLGFYLASWGMYRGSSFLLQKDYKVHIPIVRELLDEKYADLWQLDYNSLNARSPEIDTLFQLAARLKQIYRESIPTINGVRKSIAPSNILISKILLGTLGCTPAYDRFFVVGVKTVGIVASFGRNSYLGVIDFYQKNLDDFVSVQSAIAHYSVTYPVMKLVDMHFWNIGYQLR